MQASTADVDALSRQFQAATLTEPTLTLNAHTDDIHGLLNIRPGIFASGSKDTTVKLWDIHNQTQTTLPYARKKGYQYWVTALAKVSDHSFARGTRDGCITIWGFDGKELLSFAYTPSQTSKDQTRSKDRNKQRINVIARNSFGQQHTFFTGTPKFLQLWDATTGKLLKYWKAHENDWVYCIEPLNLDKMIVVTGSQMDIWSQMDKERVVTFPLIAEKRKEKQRPHISAIMRLESTSELLACALFDTSVRVVNIETQKVVQTYREHNPRNIFGKDRVWSVIDLQPNILASSADDATIKIWDLRAKQSVATLGGNPGRVSSLLKINDQQFISGSCPDDIRNSEQKAQISFWDIRACIPNAL